MPFDVAADYDAVRRRQAALRRRALVPGVARDRAARGRRRRPAERRDGRRPRQPQERARAAADPRATGSRPTRARCATSAPRASAGLRRAVVSSSSQRREVLAAAGIADLFERGSTAIVAEQEHLKGKPAPDTFLAGAEALGVDPAQAAVFEDALAGVEAGRAGGFGCVVGVDRVGQADALRQHGADVVVADLAELLDARRPRSAAGDRARRLRGRAVGGPRDRARPRAARPDRVGVRPRQRAHRAARQPRRGRAARPPRHLPERLLRGAAAALRRGRLRLSRGGPDGRSTSPTARSSACSSTTSPSTSATASCAATSGSLDFRAGVLRRERRVALAGRRRAVRVVLDPARLVRPAGGRCRSATRSKPVDEPARLVVQSELVANEPLPAARRTIPRAAAALESPLASERATSTSGARARARPPHPGERPADGGGDGPRGRGPAGRRDGDDGEPEPTSAASPSPPTSSPASGCASSSSWPTAGRASARRRRCATRSTRRWPRRRHAGWDGLLASQRALPRRVLGAAPTSSSTATPSCSRRSASRSSTSSRPAPAAERRAIAAKGLTGPGYDGHAFWDTETFVLPVLTYTAPHAAARRAALAPRDARPGPRARATQLGLEGRGLPVADDPRARSARGYWPAGTAAFHIDADIADAVDPLHGRDRATTSSSARSGLELLVETARLWRSLGHHDARRPLPHRRRHRPRRVQRHRRQQRLHEPDGAAEPAGGGRRRRALPRRRPARSASTEEEAAGWRDAAAGDASSPTTRRCGVHPQSEGFTEHERLGLRAHRRPSSTRCCCTSPTSTSTASRSSSRPTSCWRCHLRGDAFTAEEKARNFAYYEALTVRDSSLSACIQAVIAAEVGHLELAYDYFGEAALMDLDDLEHNTRDGLHIASLAGAWIAAVAGFGGMRDHDGEAVVRAAAARAAHPPGLPPRASAGGG